MGGDGKPVVWAFRVGFIRDFMKAHPDCKLDRESEYWQMYDCVDDVPGEDLDCWYCDECKGLVVYVDISRYDFKRMESLSAIDFIRVTLAFILLYYPLSFNILDVPSG